LNSKQISEVTLLPAISVGINKIEIKRIIDDWDLKETWRVRGDRCRNEFVHRHLEGGRNREEEEKIERGVGEWIWEASHGF